MAFVSTALTAFAIVVAWVIFRLERFASRQRDVAGARAVLAGVQRSMIEGLPGEPQPGWGELYFTTVYDVPTALGRALEAGDAVLSQRSWESVFVVPTEALALLATSSSDLISAETIFAANFALWRMRVFNQLVRTQDAFNAHHAVEILSADAERLTSIADATRQMSLNLHLYGIGPASLDEGWYGRLRRTVADDIERLGSMERESLWARRRGERHLVVGDALAGLLAVGVLGVGAALVYQAL